MKTSIALLISAAGLCAPLAHAQSTEAVPEPVAAPSAEATTAAAPASGESAAASADDTAKIGGLGLKFGTDGFGVQYVYGLNRFIGLRAAYQFGAYNYDSDEDGTTYQSELKINAAAGFIDIMPFGGGFRISAGVYSKTPHVTMKAQGVDQYEFGDGTYNGDLQVNASTDLGGAAPYLGIGWGGTANETGLGVSFDIGVIFGKSPKLKAQATGVACDASVDSSCDPYGEDGFDVATDPGFQAEFEQERQKLEDDAKDFRYWPVVNFGVHYRF